MMRCRDMSTSVAFYTGILDFDRTDAHDDPAECDFITGAFRQFRQRGLQTPGNPDAPTLVHEGPIDQTWGTREFYVEDTDGNTLRFTQPHSH